MAKIDEMTLHKLIISGLLDECNSLYDSVLSFGKNIEIAFQLESPDLMQKAIDTLVKSVNTSRKPELRTLIGQLKIEVEHDIKEYASVYVDPEQVICPKCKSPEKREVAIEFIGNRIDTHYVCATCGNTYTIYERKGV